MIVDSEIDPVTGLRTTIGFQEGQMKVNYSQDITDAMQWTKDLRNADDYSKQGIKANFQHIAHIPEAVCLKMMVEDGFSPYDCEAKELRSFLQRNKQKYAPLLVTRGKF